tara:strand:+ start:593 stop:718 length:126 start_codon:yes stop_codon:yes gene_type:complete
MEPFIVLQIHLELTNQLTLEMVDLVVMEMAQDRLEVQEVQV